MRLRGFVLTDFVSDAGREEGCTRGHYLEMPFRNLYHRFLKRLVESGECLRRRCHPTSYALHNR